MPHEVYCIQPSLAPIVSSVVAKSTFYILTLAWAFELRFVRRQYPYYQPVDTSKMANYTFIDTTFDGLDEYILEQKI